MSETNPIYGGDANKNNWENNRRNLAWGFMGWKLIVIVVSLLTLTIVGALFATGYLTYSTPATGVGASQDYVVVCDSDIINKYNDAMYYKLREGSTTPSIDAEGVKNVKTEIMNNAEYAKDPSCQAILFWIAVSDEDAESARTAYDGEKALYDKRAFADSNIRGNLELFSQAELLAGLESTATEEQAREVQQ